MIEVDALLFDLDGTLIDSTRDLADSVRVLQKRLGRQPSSDAEVASFIGDGVVKLVERAAPGLKGAALRREVDFFKAYYRRHCLDWTEPYEGVQKVLEHFRHKKLAIVTNKPERVSRLILDGLGILSRFRIVVGGDTLRNKKPDPAPVLHALQRMKIADPRRAVMVGDGPNDVLSGRSAGCYTCGVISTMGPKDAFSRIRPDFVVSKVLELIRIFS